MAETKRYALGNQLDIERILLEAQTRWLRPAEICEILRNHNKFRIAPEPPNKPPSGSLFLFDRKVLRYFRKDGHSWRKKKDGKTVKEAHERLKAGSVDVLHCYYAHGEDNESFQRRSYWMLEEEFMHIVLVHYREVKGNKTSFGRPRETEDVISSSQISSPLSSSYVTNHSHAPSQTTDSTSLNSAHTSEYEDVESDIYQTSSGYHSYPELQQSGNMPSTSVMASNLLGSYFPSYPNNQYSYQGKQSATSETNYTSHFEENQGRVNNGSGFGVNFEGRKELDLASWEEVFEHCTSGLENTPATMGFPLKQENVMLGQRMTQENVMLGQRMTQELNMKEEFVETHGKEKWQISPDVPKWKMDQNIDADFSSDLYTRSHVQKHNATEPFWMYSEEQNRQLSDGDLGCILEDNITVTGNFNDSEKGLKKLDSFTRWMSSELGEVGESPMESNSGVYWDTIEGDTVDAGTSVSPQVNLEAYLLSPSLSQEQLFSIVDFSPNWAYTDSETKVLITGMFLKNQEDVRKCKWSCMFGEVEVPVEILADGVLRCHAPAHTDGRVPFYVTCSNRLACSEVREFEFRTNLSRDSEMIDLYRGSTTDTDVLRTRFGKLLSLGSAGQLMSPSVCEKPEISNKINSLMKKENDEWSQMLELTSEKEFSPGKVKDHLLEKILKENLHSWLLHKVTEDGKGPNVLDKEGQGVLHLAAALGYDWAIEPTIAAGVSINFRDISGWTALHWAAFCGRERTVVALVSLGAAPGALTDPSPKFPTGKAPADLASSNGHKGIAGYLAGSSLTTHLSSLNLKDTKESGAPKPTEIKFIQTISERNERPFSGGDMRDASLKDSLAAVCIATQAAARIHQVFRVQSFQKKQIKEYGNEKLGMSDERALSLITVKTHKPGQRDGPVHTAAIKIQNKFRGWKGRKEFLIVRQRIVKIQALVRGHQVRKHYKKIIWSVGIVDKAILRWRRKGSGLRGFRSEALVEGSTNMQIVQKEDDYDFLKEGRKQTEERLQKALARVKSMVRYPEARDQYRRLLTVVTEFEEKKAAEDTIIESSEGAGDAAFDDLIDLETLLDDDTFMSTSFE